MATLKTFIIKNDWLPPSVERGWGNGYVVIPKGHPAHGKAYSDLKINVHGGLTFGKEVTADLLNAWGGESFLTDDDIGGYIYGFDTIHYGDNERRWPADLVAKETNKMADQFEKMAS